MSFPPAPYSQPSSYPTNYRPQNPSFNSETPPPPPPKPSSHEASRRGTPQTGPPLPPPPPTSLSHEISLTQQAGFPNSHTSDPTYQEQQPPEPTPQIQPPNIEDGWIPDILKDKSTTDLTTILSNPDLLSSLSTLHPSHPSTQSHLESLLTTNTTQTTHLQSLESHLTALRTTTSSLLLQHQSLELSWRKKQTEMDTLLEPWSPKALYQRLVAAVAEQEAVCRAVEESFLEGEGQGHGNEDGGGRASEREVVEWVKRIKAEGAKLEARREARARWDEGRVGGWR